MMSFEEIALLQKPEIRAQIARLCDQSPEHVALTLPEHGALIATQIKYLKRARTKLPSYYERGCIIPPLAFEQCSSEATARIKKTSGFRCLDLTCGLGVDSFYLAQNFMQVIALEHSPQLAEIARINFSRLGVDNVTVLNTSAEEYLDSLLHTTTTNEPPSRENFTLHMGENGSERPFNLIYMDPARRDTNGKKVWLLEDCSPDTISLLPKLKTLSRQVLIKLSPLFDIQEAFRLFGPEIAIEIVSLHGECKEVLLHITTVKKAAFEVSAQAATPAPATLRVTIADPEAVRYLDFDTRALRSQKRSTNCNPEEITDNSTTERYLCIPDVSLYKGRLVERYAAQEALCATSNTGYCFSRELPKSFFGRVFPIRQVMPYQPKHLKRYLKEHDIKSCNLMKKEFPFDTDTVARSLGIRQGGLHHAALTRIEERLYMILLGPEIITHDTRKP